jgi:FkbM family methyltransferase
MSLFYRLLYQIVCLAGKPFDGIRPRRMYDFLGRRAYPAPEYSWRRNRWGSELLLSPSFHIDRNIINFGCYDENLHHTLERLVQPGMICFDVGANLGEMALHMATKTGTSGRVYAFEPVPAVFERLTAHVQRNKLGAIVRALPLALSNRSGTAMINAPTPTQDNQGLGSLVNRDAQLAPLSTEINTTTLDEFAAPKGSIVST